MPAHQMRLRGPWDVRSRTGDPLAGPSTSKLPATWQDVLGDRTEPVTWRRRFHSPTGIEPGDRLVIVLEQIAGVTGVRVNGTPLREQRRAPQVCEYEFTQLLAPANILEIDQERVLNSEHPAGLWTPVILEIVPVADAFV